MNFIMLFMRCHHNLPKQFASLKNLFLASLNASKHHSIYGKTLPFIYNYVSFITYILD